MIDREFFPDILSIKGDKGDQGEKGEQGTPGSAANITTGSITSDFILDGGVGTVDIADNAVTIAKLSVTSDGTAGQVLSTDGSGTLTFVDNTAGATGATGATGKGFTGGSYDSSTGKVTFTSDDNLGFVTGDLRGAKGDKGEDGTDGAAGSDATVTAGTAFNTGDL